MVTALVSYNNSILSRFIRAASGEPASHFSICLDQKLVFHSNLFGARPVFRKSFEKSNTVFKEITIPATPEQEEAIYLNCLSIDGSTYDFGALLYFCTIGAIEFAKTKSPPKRNLWSDDRFILCTEVAKTLQPVVSLDLDLSITTPWRLIQMIEKEVTK